MMVYVYEKGFSKPAVQIQIKARGEKSRSLTVHGSDVSEIYGLIMEAIDDVKKQTA